MKIVIDLRLFGTKCGGLGRYNEQFLTELIGLDDSNQYYLIFRQKPEIDLPDNFHIVLTDCRWYSFKEQLVIPYLLYKIKPDLVHFTHFNVPLIYSGNFVVTIHDLIMTRFPSRRATTLNRFWFQVKYWFYQEVIEHAVKNSQKIIAVSNFTATDIKQHFKLSEAESDKISVVYEGVSQIQASEREPFNLPDNFFLYVGNAYPHKNLEFLISTFKKFIVQHPDYHLILVGNEDYFYRRLKQETDCDNIIFAGFVPDGKLVGYYRRARAYVFSSKYEGFGLPPLEAMSYGLPVLSSTSGSLPEVLGRAALYFDPQDSADLLDKMSEIIKNQNLRQQLSAQGYDQIKKYSWSQMTKTIWEIYKSLV